LCLATKSEMNFDSHVRRGVCPIDIAGIAASQRGIFTMFQARKVGFLPDSNPVISDIRFNLEGLKQGFFSTTRPPFLSHLEVIL